MDSAHIKEVCLEISELCQQHGHAGIAGIFIRFASEIDEGNRDGIKREIISLYNGGMGSFNDIALYKDGQVQVAATNELDKLRAQLYELVTSNW